VNRPRSPSEGAARGLRSRSVPYPPWEASKAEDLMARAALAATRARRLPDDWTAVPVELARRWYIALVGDHTADVCVARVYPSGRLRLLGRAPRQVIFLAHLARQQRASSPVARLADKAGWKMTAGRLQHR